MDRILTTMGGHAVSLGEALAAVAGLALAAILLLLLGLWRQARQRAAAEEDAAGRTSELEAQLADLTRLQSEMTGRMQTMAEVFGSRQSELLRGLSDRLDGLGHRIGQTVSEAGRSTYENLSRLNERLAVIDSAQKNIAALSGQVVELQHILHNKQQRGAFGQARMEAIIQDGLPKGGYDFQATLSNRNRPDCLVHFPNGAPGLVIDAKFPLEAWTAIRAAAEPAEVKSAQNQFRRDTLTHIKAIRDRYFIPGETQDTAFMFVPSESIFADIHEHFEDLIQNAHRARVVIVSPSLLMLSIQVMQAVLRDVRMREQAHIIQDEVARLMDDVRRLDDRVRKLHGHFAQTNKDVEEILISTRKISGRGERIEAVEIGERTPAPARADAPMQPDLIGGK
jgi:DNA recombination protein RmuC